MAVNEPESMEELLYFTNRSIDDGKARAWVRKQMCPECGKALMGKPVVKGKVKIRAKEYVCPECNHTEEKMNHEEGLMMEIIYTCPHCGHDGEATTAYKKKTFKGVPCYIFECSGCNQKIGISKKMKKGKK